MASREELQLLREARAGNALSQYALGKRYLFGFGVRDALVGEDLAVNETLEFLKVRIQLGQDLAGRVVFVPEHAEEQMVRTYSVTSCAHGFLPCIVDYGVEFF